MDLGGHGWRWTMLAVDDNNDKEHYVRRRTGANAQQVRNNTVCCDQTYEKYTVIVCDNNGAHTKRTYKNLRQNSNNVNLKKRAVLRNVTVLF